MLREFYLINKNNIKRLNILAQKINKSKFEEISRIKILDNICWTKATYAGGKIFVRNDKGRLLCFSL